MRAGESKVYRGVTITRYATGWYSALVPGHGYLKADTLAGIKELIREAA